MGDPQYNPDTRLSSHRVSSPEVAVNEVRPPRYDAELEYDSDGESDWDSDTFGEEHFDETAGEADM